MYERILLATDGNPGTPKVVRHALNVAELADGVVHVVSVVPPNAPDDDDAKTAVEEAEALAEKRGITARTAVLDGSPVEAILEYADEVGVDMIVMGTHGRTGLDRFMLGSVTEQVIRTSDVPVLAVRLDGGEAAVTDRETATEVARKALEDEGHEVAGVPEEPYRESNTWIVRAETDAGAVFNVHVEVGSGKTRLARIRS